MGSPWPRPGPEGPPRICPQPAGLGSVPHVGVSKDLRVLVILWRCGCLVALSRIHVFSPQGGVGTAHHLAVGGGPREDDVVSSLGLEERACGLTARLCQRRWAHTAPCRAEPAGAPHAPRPRRQAGMTLPQRGRPLTSSPLSQGMLRGLGSAGPFRRSLKP